MRLPQYPLLSTVSIYDEKSRDWHEWFKAARHHQGIALTNDYMIDSREEHQEFVKLPCHRLTTGDEFFFAYKTSRRSEPAIQVLKHWLTGQAQASGFRPPRAEH